MIAENTSYSNSISNKTSNFPCDYITVVHMDVPTGKHYTVDPHGKITKTPAANNAAGVGQSRYCPDLETLMLINKEISNDIHKAIILGYIKGTENGEPYRLMSVKNFEQLALQNKIKYDKFLNKPIELEGVKYATRTKRMFHASSIMVFDKDEVIGMPEELIAEDFKQWWGMMNEYFPELRGIDYMITPSASSRVSLNGVPVSCNNVHVYMQVKEAVDVERFGHASLIQSFGRGCGFMRPVIEHSTGKQIGNRTWTLFDPTTFSRERLCFDGSPIIDPADPAVINGQLTIKPSEPVIIKGVHQRFNTRFLKTPTQEEQKRLDLQFSVDKGGRVSTRNNLSLTPDVILEIKNELTGEEYEMTVQEFVEGDIERLRCQSPFRPDSSSWAAFISKEDDCTPFLFDVGTHTNYQYNNVVNLFSSAVDRGDLQSSNPVVPGAMGVDLTKPAVHSAMAVDLTKPAVHSAMAVDLTKPAVHSAIAVDLTNPMSGALHHTAPEFAESDLANAQRFSGTYSHLVRYIPMFKSWFSWIGHRWDKCETGIEFALAHKMVETMAQEAAQRADDDTFRKWAKASCSANSIKNCISVASKIPDMVVSESEIDKQWYHFCVGNGYIDLRLNTDNKLMGFCEPDRNLFITKSSNINFVKDAKAVEWEHMIWEIFSGNSNLVSFFQRMVGYSMMGRPVDEVTFFLVGDGSNGKSTITGIMDELFGEYKSIVNKKLLMSAGNNNSEAATPGLARLKGIRMAVVTETKEGDILDESVIKSLSGSDKITARHLHGNQFDYDCQFVTWLATNHAPIIKSDDFGIWRRVIQIPFKRNFAEELGNKLDRHIGERIRANEMSGILNWALEGVALYQKHGLQPPAVVMGATEEYKNEMDILANWLNDCCEIDSEFECSSKLLWQSYEIYSQETGDQIIKHGNTLSKKLRSRGFYKIKHLKSDPNTRGFKGLRLKFASMNPIVK